MLWSICSEEFFPGRTWKPKIPRLSIKWLWRKRYQHLRNFYLKAFPISLLPLSIMLRDSSSKKNRIINTWKGSSQMLRRPIKYKLITTMIGLLNHLSILFPYRFQWKKRKKQYKTKRENNKKWSMSQTAKSRLWITPFIAFN